MSVHVYLAVLSKFNLVSVFSLLVVLSVASGFISDDDRVHGIDLSLVHLTGLVPLELERWRERIVFDGEELA